MNISCINNHFCFGISIRSLECIFMMYFHNVVLVVSVVGGVARCGEFLYLFLGVVVGVVVNVLVCCKV